MNHIVKKNILGVGISNTTVDGVLEYVFDSLAKKAKPYYIVTPNPEMLMRSRYDGEFRDVLTNSEIALCDGVGLFLASKFLGKGLKQRITGVDVLEMICKESVRKPVSIGFLGGRGPVAEKTAECLVRRYPGLQVSFASEEWGEAGFEGTKKMYDLRFKIKEEDKNNFLNPKSKFLNPQIDILFVAFGFPKQEKWMAENKDKGIYRVAMGVGGAFDYFSGTVPRAPKIFQVIGLEWLYRLIRQPWRWRRQLALVGFVWLVLSEVVRSRR